MNVLAPIGLCTTCKFIKPVRSSRGSLFVMCGRAKADDRLAKYPVLPVLSCVGYEDVVHIENANSTAG